MCMSSPKSPKVETPARLELPAEKAPLALFLTKRANMQTSGKATGLSGLKVKRKKKDES